VLLLVVLLGGGDDDDRQTASSASDIETTGEPGEIFLDAANSSGPDPFTDSAAAPVPTSTIAPDTPVTIYTPSDGPVVTAPALGAATTAPPGGPATSAPGGARATTAIRGGVPGLYGGTGDQQSCDQAQMAQFLTANPSKARAFAEVVGVSAGEVPNYVNGLTPVILRSDTRVTNHGFRRGRPIARQAVLQAGTAVLVDDRGVPRARCACGNPLAPPVAVPQAPRYTGQRWPEFSPANITVIQPNTTVINTITVINVFTGAPQGVRPGGQVVPLPPPTTAAPPTTQRTVPQTAPRPTTPTTLGFRASAAEFTTRCDNYPRSLGSLAGAQPNEQITFSPAGVGGLQNGQADINGSFNLNWVCPPSQQGQTFVVTATGQSTGRQTTFTVRATA
jgi:hypothetical protein